MDRETQGERGGGAGGYPYPRRDVEGILWSTSDEALTTHNNKEMTKITRREQITSGLMTTGIFMYGASACYSMHKSFMTLHQRSVARNNITDAFTIQKRKFVRSLPGATLMAVNVAGYALFMTALYQIGTDDAE